MSVSIQESSPIRNQPSEPAKVPANILLFIAYSMCLTQDTQGLQRLANQESAVSIAVQQAETLIQLYKPCTTDTKTGMPNKDGGILSYRTMVIASLTKDFETLANDIAKMRDGPDKIKAEAELKKKGTQINEAQAQYQSDSIYCNATVNQMDTVLQKLQTAVKNDDNNLTHMTQRVKVMISLLDFTRQLIGSFKK